MTLSELAEKLSCSEQRAAEILADNSLSITDIDDTFLAALRDELQKSGLSTEVKDSEISTVSQSLAKVKPQKEPKPKKGGAIEKKGAGNIAKSTQPERLVSDRVDARSALQDAEVAAIEEAGNAGYNSDVARLAAIAYSGGLQLGITDNLKVMLPAAVTGVLESIGQVSDPRYEGIFDHLRENKPDSTEEINWNL